jgi:hypothetical protein
VFALTGVRPGPYDVTLRATVTSGRSKLETAILARARLIGSIHQ